MKENEEKNIGVVVPEKEYALLNKLVRNMKLNVESRSRSPE